MTSTKLKSISENDFLNYSDRKRVQFINSLSGFKPANVVGTANKDGQTNLAIISSVVHLGASPALIGLVFRPNTVRRDTLENIRETGSFTINHINESIVKNAHQTSARYDKEVSEFEACDLNEEYLDTFHAPFVKESLIKMAVELVREVDIAENGTHFIIGKIKHVYLPEECIAEDGHIDLHKANTVCISGLDSYSKAQKIGRLSYAKPDKELSWQ